MDWTDGADLSFYQSNEYIVSQIKTHYTVYWLTKSQGLSSSK